MKTINVCGCDLDILTGKDALEAWTDECLLPVDCPGTLYRVSGSDMFFSSVEEFIANWFHNGPGTDHVNFEKLADEITHYAKQAKELRAKREKEQSKRVLTYLQFVQLVDGYTAPNGVIQADPVTLADELWGKTDGDYIDQLERDNKAMRECLMFCDSVIRESDHADEHSMLLGEIRNLAHGYRVIQADPVTLADELWEKTDGDYIDQLERDNKAIAASIKAMRECLSLCDSVISESDHADEHSLLLGEIRNLTME